MDKELTYEVDKDVFRERLNRYTIMAFNMLPKLDKPQILDIGCGSGVPTIELARLSNGEITGIDINEHFLDKLNRKAKREGLSDRVKTMNCSMFDLFFPDGSFDIIWAEGAIAEIGFERGLKEWSRFLKPRGFLVAHDEATEIKKKLMQVFSYGYELLGYFQLYEDIWWNEYYGPLERQIIEVRGRCVNDPKMLMELDSSQHEVDMFKRNPESNRSVFFVMQRK